MEYWVFIFSQNKHLMADKTGGLKLICLLFYVCGVLSKRLTG